MVSYACVMYFCFFCFRANGKELFHVMDVVVD